MDFSKRLLSSNRKLKGSIIYFALLAALIGGILSVILLQYKDLNTRQLQSWRTKAQLRANVTGAEDLYFSGSLDVQEGSPLIQSLHGTDEDSIMISKSKWGVFDRVSVTAFYSGDTARKAFLAGQEVTGVYPSLFLANNENTVKIGGQTRLSGNLLLPNGKLDRSYAERKYYSGRKMHYGTLNKSDKFLPKLKGSFVVPDSSQFQVVSAEEFLDKKEVKVSLFSTGVWVNLSGIDVLDGVHAQGAIVLYSETPLRIKSSCKLQDVIVQAPSIIIERGAEVRAQFFAQDLIELKDYAELAYPSVIVLNSGSSTGRVVFNRSSSFSGICLALKGDTQNGDVSIITHNNTRFNGQMYSEGSAQLKGVFNGSIYSKELHLKTKSSYYKNHLIDVKIGQDLPDGFIGMPLFEEDFSNRVLLYEN